MRINDKLRNLLNRARMPRSLESVRFGDLLAGIAEDAAAQGEYSATPVKVGVWGTRPIWRVAFTIKLGDMDGYADGDTVLPILMQFVKSLNSAYPLNGFGWLSSTEQPRTTAVKSTCIVDATGTFIVDGVETAETDYVHGWIEFVTSAGNIKTGDTT